MSIDIREHGGPFGDGGGENLIGKSQGISPQLPTIAIATMTSSSMEYDITGSGLVTHISSSYSANLAIRVTIDGVYVLGDASNGVYINAGGDIPFFKRFEQSLKVEVLGTSSHMIDLFVLLD